MNSDQYIAAKKLYEAAAASEVLDLETKRFDDLTPAGKERWGKLARIAADSSPAPVCLEIEHIAAYPYKGRVLHISADVTNAGIDEAVEKFRTYLTDLAGEWKRAHDPEDTP